MDFGKLESIEQVDFRLRKEPEFNQESFAGFKSVEASEQRLYIGTTAWAEKNWIGTYFPLRTKSTEYLHYYSQQFNTIELNTSFYRIPETPTILKWYNQSPEDFRFCPKVYQYISRSRNFGINGNDIDAFIASVDLLGDKLGPSFLQLPSNADFNHLSALLLFLERINNKIPLSIEFRHPSWFTNDTEEVFSYLRDHNVSPVITDVAGRRDVCHMYITNEEVLIRFVGNNLVASDYVRIDDWINRMQYWFKMGVKNIFFFVHEPDTTDAPALATYLGQEWQKVSKVPIRYPELLENNKKQLSLF